MSNAIRFLETMGQNPALSRLSSDQLQEMIDSLELSANERDALHRRDAVALADALEKRETLFCILWEPGQDPIPADVPDEQEPLRDPTPDGDTPAEE